MKIQSGNCPNCGAVINFNPDKEFAKCEYCGVTHATNKLKKKRELSTKEIVLYILLMLLILIVFKFVMGM